MFGKTFSACFVPANLLGGGNAGKKKSKLLPTLKNLTIMWQTLTNEEFYIVGYI